MFRCFEVEGKLLAGSNLASYIVLALDPINIPGNYCHLREWWRNGSGNDYIVTCDSVGRGQCCNGYNLKSMMIVAKIEVVCVMLDVIARMHTCRCRHILGSTFLSR